MSGISSPPRFPSSIGNSPPFFLRSFHPTRMARTTKSRSTSPGGGTKEISAVAHKDQRTNIPTKELRGFVAEDEKTPRLCSRATSRSIPSLFGKSRMSRILRISLSMWCRSTSSRTDCPRVGFSSPVSEAVYKLLKNVRLGAKKYSPPRMVTKFAKLNCSVALAGSSQVLRQV